MECNERSPTRFTSSLLRFQIEMKMELKKIIPQIMQNVLGHTFPTHDQSNRHRIPIVFGLMPSSFT